MIVLKITEWTTRKKVIAFYFMSGRRMNTCIITHVGEFLSSWCEVNLCICAFLTFAAGCKVNLVGDLNVSYSFVSWSRVPGF